MKKFFESFTLVEVMVVIAIAGTFLGILSPAISVIINPPQQFQYGDRVYIKEGFFKGKSGVVVDKNSSFEYTVDIDDRKVKINSKEMAK